MTVLARRPYNVYNIFFILERAKLAKEYEQKAKKGGKTRAVAAALRKKQLASSAAAPGDLGGFDLVHLLPEFPPRYHDLKMPPDWYVPMGKANRKHVATNGLRNFEKLAQTVATNWRAIDPVTLNFCKSVAQIVKERHTELTKVLGLAPTSTRKSKMNHAKKNRKGTSLNDASIKSDALTNLRQSSACTSSVPSTIITTNHAITPDTSVIRNGEDASRLWDESAFCPQFVDEITSMPIISDTHMNCKEQTTLFLHDFAHLDETPSMLPSHANATNVVSPLNLPMPTFDMWKNDLDNISVSDFRW
ncbi:hypothetical protein ACHAWU_001734 [Discostella pseudostelligera]|uniref:Uncharacterized protein n=1 Tax=Discostella pseudostelligera TaxID=259834 RepID=A0ABD3M876_9STRA